LLIEPVVSGAACAAISLRCSACAFSMRSSASVILLLCWLAVAVVVFTVVFSVLTLSLNDLVKVRRCAMESFNPLISSALGSLAAATGSLCGPIMEAELGDPE
jgi:uncharacterized membrane protein YjfL (UPF0719 family)